MKVIIAGSRGITDYQFVCNVIKESCFNITEVVSGTAKGVDQLGERWAKDNNVPVHKFPAEWSRLGKSAGYVRNTDMGKYADCLIAIWDGESRGTKHMIDIATNLGRQIFIRKPSKWDREWK